jgi:hypothetical protein
MIILKHDEYITIRNKDDGTLRQEQGKDFPSTPRIIFLKSNEELVGPQISIIRPQFLVPFTWRQNIKRAISKRVMPLIELIEIVGRISEEYPNATNKQIWRFYKEIIKNGKEKEKWTRRLR